MELSTWTDKRSFEEAVLFLDNGEPLLILRKFSDGNGIVRGISGVLLHEVEAASGPNGDTVEIGLISYTKRLLSGRFKTIQHKLGVKSPDLSEKFEEEFTEEAHTYTNYGTCNICEKEDGRSPHKVASMQGKEVMICSSCKLKCLFLEAGGQ